ncbi:MAG: Recombinase [Bradyrhizobium sp.]|nr:Recombinase [Bradyrhizobium sp.]
MSEYPVVDVRRVNPQNASWTSLIDASNDAECRILVRSIFSAPRVDNRLRYYKGGLATGSRECAPDDKLSVIRHSPEAVAVTARAYAEESNRQSHERRADTETGRRALENIKRSIKGIMGAIEDGMYQAAMKGRMGELERQKAEIEVRLAHAPADLPDVTHSPFRSNRRDGLGFSRERGESPLDDVGRVFDFVVRVERIKLPTFGSDAAASTSGLGCGFGRNRRLRRR